SVLTNPGLIHGLQELLNNMLGTHETPVVPFFDGGNIILGGAGSDIIQGNGGNDLIDGDAWLNARISVRSAIDPNVELTSADSMTQLIGAMVSGAYSPGQLQIVREILYSATQDFDTAVFRGPAANYSIFELKEGVVTVIDNVGDDGTDTLMHIERVQFSDQAFILVPGLNQEPEGALAILDAATGTPDPTPTENQTLRVSIAGVTDGNNVGATNPTGA